MNVLVQPILDGAAAERLLHFATLLADLETTDATKLHALADREAAWARRSPGLNGQTRAYEAAARLLVDLRLLKWRLRADAYGLELESPPNPRVGPRTTEGIREAKDAVRRELAPALAQQFADPKVRRFISDLEHPPANSRRRSVRGLIADGEELYTRLGSAVSMPTESRVAAIRSAVQPYLQLVPGEGEPTVLDEFTGIPLNEIWRYFRFTWTIPQGPIPGRQMFYLVRDRAHPRHAVMGIACLGNSPLLSPERDSRIGWTDKAFSDRLRAAAESGDRQTLEKLRDYIDRCIRIALAEISPEGLATATEIEEPTDDLISRLQRRADEFAGRREDALRDVAVATAAGVPLTREEVETDHRGIPPVSLNVLELEGKRAPASSPETRARRLLVAKKRAFELARLLRSRLALQRVHDDLVDPKRTSAVLDDSEFAFALTTVLLATKSNRVGTSILEVTTCGAVPPYNHLLGGKLVALLLLSPEVAADYRRRYSRRPSIIGSQLKNEPRTKDCTLAWLNTTSLYSLGSSQYERLRLPPGVISAQQMEIRYDHIGDTQGYGTVQFSDATVRAVQAALEERHQFRGVNSIFGEGFSPKFRKLRDGMLLLGFNPTVLMRHDQTRRVFAAKLWPDADSFLRSEASVVPDYVRNPERFREATSRIAEFWRSRWLASRLNHQPALDALRQAGGWQVSDRLGGFPVKESKPGKATHTTPVPGQGVRRVKEASAPLPPSLEFWHRLAQAGPEVCADEASDEQLSRLHVPQPLDDFLLKHVREGFSVVLTGNAGDGKTHLLRRLEPEMAKLGAVVETDATAAMRPNDVSPILRRWKKAVSDGRPFCLAANEYPLHLLRLAGKGFAPLEEVDRQCEHRLVYSATQEPHEDARRQLLVVDLGLRNPLTGDFMASLLRQLLEREDVCAAAKSQIEDDFSWNHQHLGNSMVRTRLLELFGRIAAAGQRVTVRELWIWLARALFGSGKEDRLPVRSPGRWYSSRLFDGDERFAVSGLLQRFADPAAHSHPRWDLELECRHVALGWMIDGPPTLTRLDPPNFRALKRRFYFEHVHGEEALALDGMPGAKLLAALRSPQPPDAPFKQFLVESINRAYCPDIFPQMARGLYLWIGHRYHEQPSHGHFANQSVTDSQLELLRPRLPARLAGAFSYQPDHLALQYSPPHASRPIRLRVDFPLFVALEKVRSGLPRQLLPDREINRLDAFLEQLRRANVPRTTEFFIHNHDERTSLQVRLSPDFHQYEEVATP